jgi:hypothetical protein
MKLFGILQLAASLVALGSLPGGAQTEAPPVPAPLSPVIWSENADAVQRFAVNPAMVREMVDNSLLKITSAPDIATAWTRLGVTPRDVVGIKITTMGGPLLSTHRPLVQAICDGLQAAGVPPSQILIWDKFADDMIHAGYTPVRATDTHVGIAATFPGAGYDPTVFYKNEQMGALIWGDSEFVRRDPADELSDAARQAVANKTYGGSPGSSTLAPDPLNLGGGIQNSDKSYYTNLVTRICTKIINVPVLTDNYYIGINGCMGSLALGCVDNYRRFQGEPSHGDPAICEILSRDFLRRKVLIHILDALVVQYAGGPTFNPLFTQPIGALYVSRDPVAIDSLVLPRLEKWRKRNNVDPIGRTASYVHDAASYNLGTDDPSRIQLVRVR